MKKILCCLFSICVLTSVFCLASAREVDTKACEIIGKRFCPQPKSATFFKGEYVLREDSTIAIFTESPICSDVDKLEEIAEAYWGFEPKFKCGIRSELEKFKDDEYSINIDENGISITGKDLKSIKQALKTLRQMAEVARGGSGQVIAFCEIKDAPSLKFRALHLCVFPEISIDFLEKQLRLASFYKFNYVVIEFWGVFPFKSHSQFAFDDKKLDRSKLKKLIELCYEMDLTPIPQFSIFGHASQARVASGKHAVLGAHPELAELFEPLGWTYCMSNPKTEKVLKDLISELHDFFGKPPFIHFGCDEAYDKATCYECRKSKPSELFVKHLKKFNAFASSRNARAIIWHDMLLDQKDPRWKKEIASGDAEMTNALKTLSREIIIADWQYSYQDKNQTVFPTPTYFKEQGFDVLVAPWDNPVGQKALANLMVEKDLFGYLGTTWHHAWGRKMYKTFFSSAEAAWNASKAAKYDQMRTKMALNRHIIMMENDAGSKDYDENGRVQQQVILSY